MTISEFLTEPLSEIAKTTGVNKSQWCRYFKGQPFTTNTLDRAAQKLNMAPHELFLAIEKRRELAKGGRYAPRRVAA
jgi:hypothetical protein